MAVIRSLREAGGTLVANPVLLVAGLLYALVVAPQTLLSAVGIPILPTLLQLVTFFITVFILAGLIAMAYEGLRRGSTSMSTFTEIAKKRYVEYLGAKLIEVLFTFIFGFLAIIVLMFTFGLALYSALAGSGPGSSMGSGGMGAMGGIGGIIGIAGIAIFVAMLLLWLVVWFFLQFYGIAIVVDNVGIVEGYTRSYGIVRKNLLSTFAFGVIKLLLGMLLWLPLLVTVALVIAASLFGVNFGIDPDPLLANIAVQVGFAGYQLLVAVILLPLRTTYSVAFYDRIRT